MYTLCGASNDMCPPVQLVVVLVMICVPPGPSVQLVVVLVMICVPPGPSVQLVVVLVMICVPPGPSVQQEGTPLSKSTPRGKKRKSVPQKCSLCGAGFVYRRCLLRHIKENHPNVDTSNLEQYIQQPSVEQGGSCVAVGGSVCGGGGLCAVWGVCVCGELCSCEGSCGFVCVW